MNFYYFTTKYANIQLALYNTTCHKEEIHGHIFNNKILYTQYSLVCDNGT